MGFLHNKYQNLDLKKRSKSGWMETHYHQIKRIVKGTVMQIEKPLINDHFHVSKASWKFYIPIIYTFAVYKQNLMAQ